MAAGGANLTTMTRGFSENVLLGDIGATNARFALLASDTLGRVELGRVELGRVEWMEVL
jgi:glucokinase